MIEDCVNGSSTFGVSHDTWENYISFLKNLAQQKKRGKIFFLFKENTHATKNFTFSKDNPPSNPTTFSTDEGPILLQFTLISRRTGEITLLLKAIILGILSSSSVWFCWIPGLAAVELCQWYCSQFPCSDTNLPLEITTHGLGWLVLSSATPHQHPVIWGVSCRWRFQQDQ